MAPVATEHVVPTVVIKVTNGNLGSPAGAHQAGLLCNVRDPAVAFVPVEVLDGRVPGGISLFEADTVGQVDVDPAVVVIIEEGDAAALGFHDVFLVFDSAPDIRR